MRLDTVKQPFVFTGAVSWENNLNLNHEIACYYNQDKFKINGFRPLVGSRVLFILVSNWELECHTVRQLVVAIETSVPPVALVLLLKQVLTHLCSYCAQRPLECVSYSFCRIKVAYENSILVTNAPTMDPNAQVCKSREDYIQNVLKDF